MKARWITPAFLLLAWIAAASDFAANIEEKLSLSSVIDIATKNHPEIRGLQARAEQAEGRQAASPSLPPPMISIRSMGERGPLAGRMEDSIEVSQTVPFPTKLSTESRERDFERKTTLEQLHARLQALRAEAKNAYFEVYRAREQAGLLTDKRDVLEAHGKRIRSVTLSDRIAQAHLIQIQTETELARNEIEKVRQQKKIAEGKLNVVMGRDPLVHIPQIEEPPLSEFPISSNPSLAENQVENHPRLRALQASIEASEAGLSRAKSTWLPDFTFKYRYNRRFDGLMPNNSEIMAGIDLPFLFFWQPKGMVTQARTKVEEAQSLAVQTRNELRLELLRVQSEAESSRSQFLRYKNQILPQAEKRLKIAHSITPSDMESLNEHRESMLNSVDLQLAALNLRVEYEKAIAEWESLVQTAKDREK